MTMRVLKISKGGQVSVPAAVRHRWKTTRVVAEDRGDELVLRPTEDDPIAAARGAFPGGEGRLTSDEMRKLLREEMIEQEERKFGSR